MIGLHISTKHNAYTLVFMLISIMLMGGCVAVQPFPNAARAGDTITLAVGSADGMNKTNTTVDFYPDPVGDPSTFYSIPVREVLKVYPDKTSRAWLNDTSVIPLRSSHGPWLSVIVADLPTSPVLPVGTSGVMRVSYSGDVVYPRFASTGSGADIPFTVLPGTAPQQNTFDYRESDATVALTGNLSKLNSLYQVAVKPEIPAEGHAADVTFGAIQMNITIPISELNGGSVDDDGIAVVLDEQPQNILNQTQLIWKRTGDVFDIMLVSPKGLHGHEARVSIVPRWPDYLYGVSGTPILNSITYYDMDGALSAGPLPATPQITTKDNPFF